MLVVDAITADLEMAKLLISAGADVNARDNRGRSAIMKASLGNFCEGGTWYYSNIEIIKLLLKNNADLSFKDDQGEDVLSWASNQKNVVKLLSKYMKKE